MALVHVENLEKSFQNTPVIKKISFELEADKCVALIGANGAGKTTILKMLSGLLKPSDGQIFIDGEKTGGDIRRSIGYLPQHPVFFDWMTGKEFLVYIGKLSGLVANEAMERAEELLEMVGLQEVKNRRVGKYSGGMKQRLGIAQAIIHKPKLIMLDEPVSALDPFGRREVLELLAKLKKDATVLFSTHILNDAEEVSEKILFLHHGEIIETGTMDEFREKYYQAKIDLTFHGDAAAFLESLTGLEIIHSVTYSGNKAVIAANDLEAVKKALLKKAAEENWPLIKYEMSSISLEEVFMKVVGK